MVEPDVWGPPIWRAIHFVALGYPDSPSAEDAAKYKRFFEDLGAVIPCSTCSVNYSRHLQELPIDDYLSGGRMRLFEWSVRVHNIVNAEKGKPLMDPATAYALMVSPSPKGLSCPIDDPTAGGANLPVVMTMATIAAIIGAVVMFLIMRACAGRRR